MTDEASLNLLSLLPIKNCFNNRADNWHEDDADAPGAYGQYGGLTPFGEVLRGGGDDTVT